MNTTIDPEIKSFFNKMNELQKQKAEAAAKARPALTRLVKCCLTMTGQAYIVRALLYSLWNGKRADISDILRLDYNLRQDFAAVLLAFGFESPERNFFYDEIKHEFQKPGLFDWFCEAGER